MIMLYHCDAARSFRPLWMLEEQGLPYDLKMLPFPPRARSSTSTYRRWPSTARGDASITQYQATATEMGCTCAISDNAAHRMAWNTQSR